jgi:hypothetical protein
MWVVADTGDANFGKPVEEAVIRNPANIRAEGAVAIVRLQGRWTAAERVLPGDLTMWMGEKRAGAGRDPRVGGSHRDNRGRNLATTRQALADQRDIPVSDSPFSGPKAIIEILDEVLGSGDDFMSYHEIWLRETGLNGDSAVGHQHRNLLSILYHMYIFDQLNLYHLASAELLARHMKRIHRAVRKNPKNPDFRGLNLVVQSRLDRSTYSETGEFSKHIAQEQKEEAFTMKQQRLFAEEVAHGQDLKKKKGEKD